MTVALNKQRFYPQVPVHEPVKPELLNSHLRYVTDQVFDLDTAAAVIAQKAANLTAQTSYTVAKLPTGAGEGQITYASNGRKTGEGAGSGTGIPVYFSRGVWRRYYDDAQVTA